MCWFLLHNNMNQPQLCISPLPFGPPSDLPLPLLSVITDHWVEFPVLCSMFPLMFPILHIVVYICQCCSLNSSQPLLPPLCLQVHFLHLQLYSCHANRFISTVCLYFLYICYYIFTFLFLTYCTLYNRL